MSNLDWFEWSSIELMVELKLTVLNWAPFHKELRLIASFLNTRFAIELQFISIVRLIATLCETGPWSVAMNLTELISFPLQLRKLGLLLPEQRLVPNIRSIYQDMWANNGDIISRQYAGTAALKGDYTRTGERKFTGMMKDGYNSANRYVQNQFKDAFRQVAIGQCPSRLHQFSQEIMLKWCTYIYNTSLCSIS